MMDGMSSAQLFQQGVAYQKDRVMNRFDADGSGDITRAEAGNQSGLARNFDTFDLNQDGTVDGGELEHGWGEKIAHTLGMSHQQMQGAAAYMQMQEMGEHKLAEFNRLDMDGDGMLSDAELTAEMEAIQAAQAAEEARQAKIAEFTRMDSDGDGMLSTAELQAELDARAAAQAQAEADAVAAFDGIDSDGDGSLSETEIAAALAAQQNPVAPEDTAGDIGTDATDDAMMADDATATTDDGAMADDMASTGDDAMMGDDAAMADTAPAEDAAAMPLVDDAAMADDAATMPAADDTAAADDMAPAEEAVAANTNTDEAEVLSLIENVFSELAEDRGLMANMDQLATMSQSLYADAQQILLDELDSASS